ncbi:MAG: tetratricopeptide repeat protein, partial [Cyanobacteria bacterium SBLK]|nr:tetratricopeptide repeat protein [Cyanobacteria bacterium SBLK]
LQDKEKAAQLLRESLDAARNIDDSSSQSDVLIAIASAFGQLQDEEKAAQLLRESLDVTRNIDDPSSQSDVLIAIASAFGQLQDEKEAVNLLQESLKAAKNIYDPSSQSSVLREIASASGDLTNWEATQTILRDALSAAEAANAAEALQAIAFQYALHEDWGKALRALRNCPESAKIEALAQILTLWAEKKNPQLIDGAVVLNLDVEGTPNNYTFNVSLYSRDSGCDNYADWWEVLGEDGELLDRHVFDKSHPDAQPFTSFSESIKIPEDKTVIVRTHMNNTGYEARQAWKGSVKKGFKFVRLSENFAASVAKEDPQPPECKE